MPVDVDYEARVAGVQQSLEDIAASRQRARGRREQLQRRRAEARAARTETAGHLP